MTRPRRTEAPSPPKPIWLEGVPVHPFTVDSLHEYLGHVMEAGNRARVLNVNVHAMNLAHRNPDFRQCLLDAEAVFCDGEGVRLGARLLGHRLPTRITYADWIWQLARWGADRGASFFFLGARPGIAQDAAEKLRERFPTLRVVGARHGYWRREGLSDEQVVQDIRSADPDVLVLGLGMPFQELWLSQWWPELGVKIGLTGGACFDYASGAVKRCPAWMRRYGLEWLYRLGQEPHRLFRRYVLGNPWFLVRTLWRRWTGRT